VKSIDGKSNGLIIKSWCDELEKQALAQAVNLSKHPCTFHHVALMPDCHVGYGMPIGGVVALKDAVIPNAVGVN
jgi:tRNA-splicing ligase RtcB (3'-phosphate/5'-hydroxy nucleic acid ligase)